MKPSRSTYLSARAQTEMKPGGVLLVKMSGTITASAVSGLRGHIKAQPGAAKIKALVIDYTKAIVAMDADSMASIIPAAPTSIRVRLPLAVVATPETVEVFAEHCRRMAGRTLLRQVFTSQAEALEWAETEASHQ